MYIWSIVVYVVAFLLFLVALGFALYSLFEREPLGLIPVAFALVGFVCLLFWAPSMNRQWHEARRFEKKYDITMIKRKDDADRAKFTYYRNGVKCEAYTSPTDPTILINEGCYEADQEIPKVGG